MVFNGAPSFVARMFNGSYSENVITVNKVNNELYFAIIMTGIPPGEIPTCVIGKDSAHPGKLESYDDKGKHFRVSIHAIEETKSIKIDFLYVEEERRLLTTRNIREDGFMSVRVDASKKDGSSQYYTAVYKRA